MDYFLYHRRAAACPNSPLPETSPNIGYSMLYDTLPKVAQRMTDGSTGNAYQKSTTTSPEAVFETGSRGTNRGSHRNRGAYVIALYPGACFLEIQLRVCGGEVSAHV